MKIMEVLAGSVVKRPMPYILIVALITVLSLVALAINGMESNFSEDSFNPDLPIANADSEIQQDYVGTYSIMILVRAQDDDNFMTPQGMDEILELQYALATDPEIRPYFSHQFDANETLEVLPFLVMQQIMGAYNISQDDMGAFGETRMMSMDMGGDSNVTIPPDAPFSVRVLVQAEDGNLITPGDLSTILDVQNTTFHDATLTPSYANSSIPAIPGYADILSQMLAAQMVPDIGMVNQTVLEQTITGAYMAPETMMLIGATDVFLGGGYNVTTGNLTSPSLLVMYQFNGSIPEAERHLIEDSLKQGLGNASIGATGLTFKVIPADLLTAAAGVIPLPQTQIDAMLDTSEKLALESNIGPITYPDIMAQYVLNGSLMNPYTGIPLEQKKDAFDNMTQAEVEAAIMAANNDPRLMATLPFLEMAVSKDFNGTSGNLTAKGTIIQMSFNPDLTAEERTDIEVRVDEIVNELNDRNDVVRFSPITGERIMGEMMDANNESFPYLLGAAFGFIILILYLVYRNLFDMGISLLGLLLSIVWMFGFGAAAGFDFNPIVTMVPILLVGLGIDYGIHITMRYREELQGNDDVKESIKTTLRTVGVALILCTITTVLAFLSNLTSPIDLLADFGILAAVGIISAFFIMVTLVPAAKSIRDLARQKKGKKLWSSETHNGEVSRGQERMDRIILGPVKFQANNLLVSLVVVVLITAGLGIASQNLETTFDFNDFLPDGLEITDDIDFLTENFDINLASGERVNVLVKGDVADPAVMLALHTFHMNLQDDDPTLINETNTESVLTVFLDWSTQDSTGGALDFNFDREFALMFNTTFNVSGPVPMVKDNATREGIVYLLDLLASNEGGNNALRRYIHHDDDGVYDGTVVRVLSFGDLNDKDGIKEIKESIEDDALAFDTGVAGDETEDSIVTSGPVLTSIIMDSIDQSQINSLMLTIMMSIVILTILFMWEERSIALGVLTLLPVMLVIVWTFGTMYLVGIGRNVITITIASLSVGLGITYGIHVTHRFLEDLREKLDARLAWEETVKHTGAALVGAASTTVVGFGMLSFSILPPIQQFGQITALSILYSLLSSVFVLPMFLYIWATKSGFLEKLLKDNDGPAAETPTPGSEVETSKEPEPEPDTPEEKVEEEQGPADEGEDTPDGGVPGSEATEESTPEKKDAQENVEEPSKDDVGPKDE